MVTCTIAVDVSSRTVYDADLMVDVFIDIILSLKSKQYYKGDH